MIVTEVFVHEAKMQRAALGMDGLEPVVITHPLSTLTDAEIADRAAEAAAAAKTVLLGAGAKKRGASAGAEK